MIYVQAREVVDKLVLWLLSDLRALHSSTVGSNVVDPMLWMNAEKRVMNDTPTPTTWGHRRCSGCNIHHVFLVEVVEHDAA